MSEYKRLIQNMDTDNHQLINEHLSNPHLNKKTKKYLEKLLEKRPIRSQALIINQGKFLVLKCFGYKYQEIFYTLPGGSVDLNESPSQALKREVYEELGVRVQITHTIPPFTDLTDDDFYLTYHTFVCHLLDPLPDHVINKETNSLILDTLWLERLPDYLQVKPSPKVLNALLNKEKHD